MDEDKTPTVKIRSMSIVPGVNPFEALLLTVCLALSLTHPFGLTPPSSISGSMPAWAVSLWYANLGIGSAIALYGGIVAKVVVPGRNERPLKRALGQYAIGWLYVGTASITYGMLILLRLPDAGAVPGSTTIAWGIASLLRANQVRRLLQLRGGGHHRHV